MTTGWTYYDFSDDGVFKSVDLPTLAYKEKCGCQVTLTNIANFWKDKFVPAMHCHIHRPPEGITARDEFLQRAKAVLSEELHRGQNQGDEKYFAFDPVDCLKDINKDFKIP